MPPGPPPSAVAATTPDGRRAARDARLLRFPVTVDGFDRRAVCVAFDDVACVLEALQQRIDELERQVADAAGR